MSKEKARPAHNTDSKKRAKLKTTQGPKLGAVGWIALFATLLGGLVALITFVPRVSMSPNDPTDPNNPFSATFTVTNTTAVPIPIYHVGARLFVGQVLAEPLKFAPPTKFGLGSGGFTRPEWQDHTLRADERFTISPEGIFGLQAGAKLSGADIAVIVKYQPWFLPIERESVFRFVTQHHGNGSITWYSIPVD